MAKIDDPDKKVATSQTQVGNTAKALKDKKQKEIEEQQKRNYEENMRKKREKEKDTTDLEKFFGRKMTQ